jgi:hypothetical protein
MSIPFAEIARAVKRHADEDAAVLVQCEALAVELMVEKRQPGAERGPAVIYGRPGVERELDALRQRTAAIKQGHELIAALAPIERPVRLALAAHAAFKRFSTRLSGRNQGA